MSANNSSLPDTLLKNVDQLTFGSIDYSIFIVMLCMSTLIGTYFGFFAKKQDNTTEYLLGGKTMSYFPVAMSLTASHLSGVTLLGIPAEVYQYGTQYAMCVITCILVGLVTSFVFLPVFYKLQLTSTFEYLELRFGRSVRQFASVLFTINLILHTPIVVYVPALAIAQVTGFDLHYVAPIIGTVCIFYTAVGGLKAVVWSDTIQFTITIFTLFTVLVLGIISIGGLTEIWRISGEGGRLILFDMNPSPFVRTSFFGVTIGMTTGWIANLGLSQSSVQRFLAVPTISEARKSIVLMCFGIALIKNVSVFTGLIMFSKYHDCDPITTGAVKKSDQMLPHYVMDVAGGIPGLPGLFFAALVSAALSAMSGGLNTAAGTIWEDFISPWIPESETKQNTATKVMKVTVVVLGIICVALVLVVEHLGDVFTMSISMAGVTTGTLIGFFTLGTLIPPANYKGCVIGGIAGFVTTLWLIVGAQLNKINGTLHYDPLPTSTDNCAYPLNMTDWIKPSLPPIKPDDEPMILFTMSALYYPVVGFIAVVITGTIASFITGVSDQNELNRDLFSPLVQRFLPREKYAEVPMADISTILSNKEQKKKEASNGF